MLQKKALDIQNADYTSGSSSESPSESISESPSESLSESLGKSPSTSSWFEEQEGQEGQEAGRQEAGVGAPKNITQQQVDEKIILAAGCFWGVEARLRRIDGVLDTKVGYIGGAVENPTYKQVCYENTEHAEACQVTFNTKKTNLNEILKVFWQIHNPTEVNRQGADVGRQYRSAIFYCQDEQREVVEKSCEQMQRQLARKISTEILKAPRFWLAEEYHQRYIDKKNGAL